MNKDNSLRKQGVSVRSSVLSPEIAVLLGKSIPTNFSHMAPQENLL